MFWINGNYRRHSHHGMIGEALASTILRGVFHCTWRCSSQKTMNIPEIRDGTATERRRGLRRWLQQHQERFERRRLKFRERQLSALEDHGVTVPDGSDAFSKRYPWLSLLTDKPVLSARKTELFLRVRRHGNRASKMYFNRHIRSDPSWMPKANDFQNMIASCERARVGVLQAARLLQKMQSVYGVGPTVGCVSEFARLCAEMRAEKYLRWSDAVVRAVLESCLPNASQVRANATSYSQNKISFKALARSLSREDRRKKGHAHSDAVDQTSDDLVWREYRHVMFRYILELGTIPYANGQQYTSDARIVELFSAVTMCIPSTKDKDDKTIDQSTGDWNALETDVKNVTARATSTGVMSCLPATIVDIVAAAALRLGRLHEAANILFQYRNENKLEGGIHHSSGNMAPPPPSLVGSLLTKCASHGLLPEALEVLAYARGVGYRARPRDLVSIFDAARLATTEGVAEAINPSDTAPTHRFLSWDARTRSSYLSHDLVFYIYHRAVVLSGSKVTSDILFAMLRAISIARPYEQRAERALAIFREARRRRIKVSSTFLYQILMCCVAGGDVRRALACYAHIAGLGFELQISAANALASLCLMRGHNRTAKAIFEDIAARGSESPEHCENAETLSLMVRYWAQVGNEDRAHQGFQQILTIPGMRPTETAYVAMIRLAAEKGDVEAAMGWMRALERGVIEHAQEKIQSKPVESKSKERLTDALEHESSGVVVCNTKRMPSERAFRALFQALRKAAAADTAVGLLSEYAARYEYQPSPVVYMLVIHTCLRASRIDYVRQLRLEMNKRGVIAPDVSRM